MVIGGTMLHQEESRNLDTQKNLTPIEKILKLCP